MANRTIAGIVALAAFATTVSNATPTVAAPDFPSAVAQVLQSQQKGPVSKLDAGRKQQLIACVNGVLAGLPNGKKRYIVEAASFDELEDRFGDVVMENRAEWKQKIAKGCSHIVV
jgi:hypothetical protein